MVPARRIHLCTDKKEKKIFLVYMEIQKGSGAKPYMRKGFLIYEEGLPNIWGSAQIFSYYKEAVKHIWLCTRSLLKFLKLYLRKNQFSFSSVFDWSCPETSLLFKHYWSYYPPYLWHSHRNDPCTKHAPSPTIPKIRNKYWKELRGNCPNSFIHVSVSD